MNEHALKFPYDYLVVGLPRSGTLWLSNFLTFGNKSICLHEPYGRERVTLNGIRDYYDSVGMAMTCGNLVGRSADKTVCIIRDEDESWEAFTQTLGHDDPFTKRLFKRSFDSLVETAMTPGALILQHTDMFNEWACARLWEYLFEEEMPRWRYDEISRMDVKVVEEEVEQAIEKLNTEVG